MAKSPVDRILGMLSDEAPERRLAATIVLGELKAKRALPALSAMLEADGPALQRHALDAIRRIGPQKKTAKLIWPLLSSRDPEVRRSAAGAIAALGDSVVPEVRVRLAEAEGHERRALESVLSQLGGKVAFDALLEALEDGDEETNRQTALELRTQLRDASATVRRTYRGRLEKLIERLVKSRELNVSALATAVKVLGYLEDPSVASRMLALAKDPKLPAVVRQEALIGLRFATAHGRGAKGPNASTVLKVLVRAAAEPDRALAQTALMTLVALEVPPAHASAICELAMHRELDRARMAIDKLRSIEGTQASETLVDIVARADKRRAELAADALEDRDDALRPLAKLMATVTELERAKLVRRALEPRLDRLTAAQRKAILNASVARLVAGEDGYGPGLDLIARRDPKKTHDRLREEAQKLRRRKKLDAESRVLSALIERGGGTDADRFRRAAIALRASKLHPQSRASDPAVGKLRRLQQSGFDVVGALRSDRGLDLDHLFYVGFCFLEDDVDGGEDLLEIVVDKGGRKKIARAAKNKLKLVRAG